MTYTCFQIATDCIASNLLKYAAKDYFFKALLCHLCVDSLNAVHALSRYEDQYPAFTDSREAKLIKSLCQVINLLSALLSRENIRDHLLFVSKRFNVASTVILTMFVDLSMFKFISRLNKTLCEMLTGSRESKCKCYCRRLTTRTWMRSRRL